jgi:hypothetical protein
MTTTLVKFPKDQNDIFDILDDYGEGHDEIKELLVHKHNNLTKEPFRCQGVLRQFMLLSRQL